MHIKPLAHWSGRHIAVVWVFGLLIQQTALFAAGFRWPRAEPVEELSLPWSAAETEISQARRDSLLAVTYVYLRDHAREGASAVTGASDRGLGWDEPFPHGGGAGWDEPFP